MTKYIHVTDPPIYLGNNETLRYQHIVCYGTLLGRVLFTEAPTAIEVCAGSTVLMQSCSIEGDFGCGVRVREI